MGFLGGKAETGEGVPFGRVLGLGRLMFASRYPRIERYVPRRSARRLSWKCNSSNDSGTMGTDLDAPSSSLGNGIRPSPSGLSRIDRRTADIKRRSMRSKDFRLGMSITEDEEGAEYGALRADTESRECF